MCARDADDEDDGDEDEDEDNDTAEEDNDDDEVEEEDDDETPSLALLHGTRRRPAAAPLLNSHHFKCSSLVVPVLSQSSLSCVARRGTRRPLVQRAAMGRRCVGSGAVEDTWARVGEKRAREKEGGHGSEGRRISEIEFAEKRICANTESTQQDGKTKK